MNRTAVVARRVGLRMASTSAPTSFAGVRQMGALGAWLRDQPNAVPAAQKFFQESEKETFMKKDSDKAVMAFVFAVGGAGLLMAGRGESLEKATIE